jgi:hypothetical protein
VPVLVQRCTWHQELPVLKYSAPLGRCSLFFILVTLVEILYIEYLAANRLDIPHPSQLAKFHHILAIPETLIAGKIMCIF